VVFGDGEQTRDFIYVKDIVAANAHLAASPRHGVFNVARGETCTVNELAATIIRLTGSQSRLRHEPPRAGDIRHSRADTSALRATGFSPAVPLATALGETIAACRAARG